MDWQPIKTAPKNKEVLLLGKSYHGRESIQYGTYTSAMVDNWVAVVESSDEVRKVNQRREEWHWDTGSEEIFPEWWMDVQRPCQKPEVPNRDIDDRAFMEAEASRHSAIRWDR